MQLYRLVTSVALALIVVISDAKEGPTLEDLTQKLYKGVGCASCLAVSEEVAQTIDYMHETMKEAGEKDIKQFQTRLLGKLEAMCAPASEDSTVHSVTETWGLSKGGFQLIRKAFDTAEKESADYETTEMVKIDRGPYFKVLDGELEALLTDEPERQVPHIDVEAVKQKALAENSNSWRAFVAGKLQAACDAIKGSSELEEYTKDQKLKPKHHRSLCVDLQMCKAPLRSAKMKKKEKEMEAKGEL